MQEVAIMGMDWRKMLAGVVSILIGIWLLYHRHEYVGAGLILGPVILMFVFPWAFEERALYRYKGNRHEELDWKKTLSAVMSILVGLWMVLHHHEYIGGGLVAIPFILLVIAPLIFEQ